MPGPINAITLSRVRTHTPSDKSGWAEAALRLPFPGARRVPPTVASGDSGARGGFARPTPVTVTIPAPPTPAPPKVPPGARQLAAGWSRVPVRTPVRTLAPAPAPIPPSPSRQAAPRAPSWARPGTAPITPQLAGWSKPAVAPVRPTIANAQTAVAARRPDMAKLSAHPVTNRGPANYYSPAALRQDAIQRQAAATGISTTKVAATPAAPPIGRQTGTQAVSTGKPAVAPSSGAAHVAGAGHWKFIAAGVALVAIAAHLSR